MSAPARTEVLCARCETAVCPAGSFVFLTPASGPEVLALTGEGLARACAGGTLVRVESSRPGRTCALLCGVCRLDVGYVYLVQSQAAPDDVACVRRRAVVIRRGDAREDSPALRTWTFLRSQFADVPHAASLSGLDASPQIITPRHTRLPSLNDVAGADLRALTRTRPRAYQVEAFVACALSNALLVLPTGAGKTLVAAMLLALFARKGDKAVALLVDKVALAHQQAAYVRAQTGLDVLALAGDAPPEDVASLPNRRALVATAQVFANALASGRVRASDYSLVIFDEAHHAAGRHAYATLLAEHVRPLHAASPQCAPRVVGLSASPAGGASPAHIAGGVAALCGALCGALVFSPFATRASLASAAAFPAVVYDVAAEPRAFSAIRAAVFAYCRDMHARLVSPGRSGGPGGRQSATGDSSMARHGEATLADGTLRPSDVSPQSKSAPITPLATRHGETTLADGTPCLSEPPQQTSAAAHAPISAQAVRRVDYRRDSHAEEIARLRGVLNAAIERSGADACESGSAVAVHLRRVLAALDVLDVCGTGPARCAVQAEVAGFADALHAEGAPGDLVLAHARLSQRLAQEIEAAPPASAPKTDALLAYLRRASPEGAALVFAATRRRARLLCARLSAEEDVQRRWAPAVLVGRAPESPDGMAWDAAQTHVLARLRAGSTRLLVATAVLHEGIDVPACAHVALFDASCVSSLPAAVQTRGRARKRDATLVVLGDAHEVARHRQLMADEDALLRIVGRRMAASAPRGLLASVAGATAALLAALSDSSDWASTVVDERTDAASWLRVGGIPPGRERDVSSALRLLNANVAPQSVSGALAVPAAPEETFAKVLAALRPLRVPFSLRMYRPDGLPLLCGLPGLRVFDGSRVSAGSLLSAGLFLSLSATEAHVRVVIDAPVLSVVFPHGALLWRADVDVASGTRGPALLDASAPDATLFLPLRRAPRLFSSASRADHRVAPLDAHVWLRATEADAAGLGAFAHASALAVRVPCASLANAHALHDAVLAAGGRPVLLSSVQQVDSRDVLTISGVLAGSTGTADSRPPTDAGGTLDVLGGSTGTVDSRPPTDAGGTLDALGGSNGTGPPTGAAIALTAQPLPQGGDVGSGASVTAGPQQPNQAEGDAPAHTALSQDVCPPDRYHAPSVRCGACSAAADQRPVDPQPFLALGTTLATTTHPSEPRLSPEMAESLCAPESVRYALAALMSHAPFAHYAPARLLSALQGLDARMAEDALHRLHTRLVAASRTGDAFPDVAAHFEAALRMGPLRRDRAAVRSAVVTPGRVLWLPATRCPPNRVLRAFGASHFLRVRFRDEDGGRLSPSGGSLERVYARIRTVVEGGLAVAGTRYEFVGASGSQLRDHGCWFVAPFTAEADVPFSQGRIQAGTVVTAALIREWVGDLGGLRSMAKYVARLGLAFSSSAVAADVPPADVRRVPDVCAQSAGREYVFSDGVGTVSPGLCREIQRALGRHGPGAPRAFQIRYGGCKGVVAEDPLADGDSPSRVLSVRPSMEKFPSAHTHLEVLAAAEAIPCFLNRQVVLILVALGVPDAVFERLQRAHLRELRATLTRPCCAARTLASLLSSGPLRLPLGYLRRAQCLPFFRAVLSARHCAALGELQSRSRIRVPHGRILLGVLDETGTLAPDEVFVRISQCVRGETSSCGCSSGTHSHEFGDCVDPVGNTVHPVGNTVDPAGSSVDPMRHPSVTRCTDGHTAVIEGTVVVAKNPCMHPGDVRVLRAVHCPPLLAHHVDVVVFSQRGERPVPNMCSGSDLDGDLYWVSWDAGLLPPRTAEPMDYAGVESAACPAPRDAADVPAMAAFVADYVRNDHLGPIANAHVAHADARPGGVCDALCVRLARLFALAVDFAKTGFLPAIPPDARVERWPDYMQKGASVPSYPSQHVLGRLFRQVRRLCLSAGLDSSVAGAESFENAKRCDESWADAILASSRHCDSGALSIPETGTTLGELADRNCDSDRAAVPATGTTLGESHTCDSSGSSISDTAPSLGESAHCPEQDPQWRDVLRAYAAYATDTAHALLAHGVTAEARVYAHAIDADTAAGGTGGAAETLALVSEACASVCERHRKKLLQLADARGTPDARSEIARLCSTATVRHPLRRGLDDAVLSFAHLLAEGLSDGGPTPLEAIGRSCIAHAAAASYDVAAAEVAAAAVLRSISALLPADQRGRLRLAGSAHAHVGCASFSDANIAADLDAREMAQLHAAMCATDGLMDAALVRPNGDGVPAIVLVRATVSRPGEDELARLDDVRAAVEADWRTAAVLWTLAAWARAQGVVRRTNRDGSPFSASVFAHTCLVALQGAQAEGGAIDDAIRVGSAGDCPAYNGTSITNTAPNPPVDSTRTTLDGASEPRADSADTAGSITAATPSMCGDLSDMPGIDPIVPPKSSDGLQSIEEDAARLRARTAAAMAGASAADAEWVGASVLRVLDAIGVPGADEAAHALALHLDAHRVVRHETLRDGGLPIARRGQRHRPGARGGPHFAEGAGVVVLGAPPDARVSYAAYAGPRRPQHVSVHCFVPVLESSRLDSSVGENCAYAAFFAAAYRQLDAARAADAPPEVCVRPGRFYVTRLAKLFMEDAAASTLANMQRALLLGQRAASRRTGQAADSTDGSGDESPLDALAADIANSAAQPVTIPALRAQPKKRRLAAMSSAFEPGIEERQLSAVAAAVQALGLAPEEGETHALLVSAPLSALTGRDEDAQACHATFSPDGRVLLRATTDHVRWLCADVACGARGKDAHDVRIMATSRRVLQEDDACFRAAQTRGAILECTTDENGARRLALRPALRASAPDTIVRDTRTKTLRPVGGAANTLHGLDAEARISRVVEHALGDTDTGRFAHVRAKTEAEVRVRLRPTDDAAVVIPALWRFCALLRRALDTQA